MKTRLYDEYLKRLVEVNDEKKTEREHREIKCNFYGWLEGVEDATGHTFNGDYFYLEKFKNGELKERPTCCGQFLDWRSKEEKK